MAIIVVLLSVIFATVSIPRQLDVPQKPSVDLPPELARVLTDYEAAWSQRDAAALAKLFAEDGFVLPGGRPPVRGRAAIEKHYTGQGGPLSLRALAYAVDGKVGYIIGGYGSQKGAADVGKFTLTLRRGADKKCRSYPTGTTLTSGGSSDVIVARRRRTRCG